MLRIPYMPELHVHALLFQSTKLSRGFHKHCPWSFPGCRSVYSVEISHFYCFLSQIRQNDSEINPERFSSISERTLSSDREKGYLSSWLLPSPSVERVEAVPGWPLHQPMVAGSANVISLMKGLLWRERRTFGL